MSSSTPNHPQRPKGVPAWAWPEPSGPRTEPEPPTSDPVDRSQFVIVATEDFTYKDHTFTSGAHLKKDHPLVAEVIRRHPGWLVPATPQKIGR